MLRKDFTVKANTNAEPIKLTAPEPETIEEFGQLVSNTPEDVINLAHRQFVVDLQSYLRRNWPEGLRGDELRNRLQQMTDEFRYGAAAPRGPRSVALPEGVKISQAAREALAAQGVIVSDEVAAA